MAKKQKQLAPIIIPDTEEVFKVMHDHQRNFLDGFMKALPNLPLDDRMKEEFRIAAEKQRSKLEE
jgi:hypothetical protein